MFSACVLLRSLLAPGLYAVCRWHLMHLLQMQITAIEGGGCFYLVNFCATYLWKKVRNTVPSIAHSTCFRTGRCAQRYCYTVFLSMRNFSRIPFKYQTMLFSPCEFHVVGLVSQGSEVASSAPPQPRAVCNHSGVSVMSGVPSDFKGVFCKMYVLLNPHPA